MNSVNLINVLALMSFLTKALTLENRFLVMSIDNNISFDLNSNLKINSTIKALNRITRLKCSSKCSLEIKCLSFSYSKTKSHNVCRLFSFDQFNSFNVVVDLNTKIYKKIANSKEILSTSTHIIDYTCVNQDCTCLDSSKFYSTIQKKCIKCRDGWKVYKNMCYKAFADAKRWSDYVSFCNSLNSTLLMPIDPEKFNFFFDIAKNLTAINSNIRLWVSARYDVQSVYQWTNGESLNISFISPFFHDSSSIGFYAYMVINKLPQLSLSVASSSSNGVCEYFE